MDEYVYHITKKEVAFNYIKTGGLKPASQLTGTSVARGEGSFAADRDKNMETKVIAKLKGVLWQAAKRGYSSEEVKNKNYSFNSAAVDLNSERDDAFIALGKFEENFYDQYFPKRAGNTGKPVLKNFQDPAEKMFRENPNHSLCKFAGEYVRLNYAIEERVTSNHIYFFAVKDAPTCYPDYTNFHGGEIRCRVLRVKRSTINHLEQDMAEFRGLMTNEAITPHNIEIYNTDGNPFSSSAGAHWAPVSEA